jgi:hypothetical protein
MALSKEQIAILEKRAAVIAESRRHEQRLKDINQVTAASAVKN